MRSLLPLPLLFCLLIALSGCGGDAAAPTAVALTADSALAALKAAGLPIGETTIYTADTDPNKLLGRPNQYIAKLSWHDTRLPAPKKPNEIGVNDGGGLELFADAAAAKARVDYITGLGKATPFLVEYDYQHGPLMLRLSMALTPDQAAAYKAALDTLP